MSAPVLLGENCKYNGKNNRNETLIQRLQSHEVIPVCPEVLGGLGVPRPCVELRAGCGIQPVRVDAAFHTGVEKTLAQIEGQPIDLVMLQSRSPTCGVKQIYDGNFQKRLSWAGHAGGSPAGPGISVVDVEDVRPCPTCNRKQQTHRDP